MEKSNQIDISMICADYGIKSISSLGIPNLQDDWKHELHDKLVVMRVDFNLPMSACGTIVTDISRAKSSALTVKYLMSCGAKILLISHFGQPTPDAATDPAVRQKYSLNKVITDIRYTLSTDVVLIEPDDYQSHDKLADTIQEVINQKPNDQVFLLENIRFYQGEILNDGDFASVFANMAYIYVNDAFSASHRTHASVCGIPSKMKPNKRFAGMGLLSELVNLERYVGRFVHQTQLGTPKITAIVAGKKVSTKLPTLEVLAQKVDHLILGGAIANTFLQANGIEIGDSYYEKSMIPKVLKLQQMPKML